MRGWRGKDSAAAGCGQRAGRRKGHTESWSPAWVPGTEGCPREAWAEAQAGGDTYAKK